MRNRYKWGLAVVFFMLVGVIVKRIDDYHDYVLTVITDGHKFSDNQNVELLKNEAIEEEFRARRNNLGIIEVKFDTHNRINDDYLQFSIKEAGDDNWYYSNKYKVDQFQDKGYFPFGFPPIGKSKGKNYQVEIRSLAGEDGNSVGIIRDGWLFLSKHSFSKDYLWQNKGQIPTFIYDKIVSCLSYVDWIFCLLVLTNIFVSAFFVSIVIFYFLKLRIWQRLTGLKNSLVVVIVRIGKTIVNFIRGIKLSDVLLFIKSRKVEVLLVLFIYVSLTIYLTLLLYYRNIQAQYGDSTFAAQMLINIGKNFKYETSFGRSIEYGFTHIFYKSAEFVCSSPLASPAKFFPWGHYYLIASLLGLLTRFFDIYWYMAFLHALIFSFILLFVYVTARKFKVNVLNSTILVLIASQHPIWSWGLYGQFYFNRFFMLFGGLLIWLLSSKKLNYFWITVFSLLALASNEIYGISLLMIMIVYSFIFKRDKKLFLLGMVCFSISVFLITKIHQSGLDALTQNSVINGTLSGGLFNIIKNISKVVFTENSGKFMLVNLVFGGFIVLLKPKVFLAWLFLLMPNLMVYVGKLTWSTHYHNSYFVPCLWLLIYVVANIRLKRKWFLTLGLLVFLMAISRFKVESYKMGKSVLALDKTYEDLRSIYLNKNNILFRFNGLRSQVAEGDKISLPEAVAYNFLDHEISYYPMDID
ncbi:hypothetical protein KJ909_00635, partial [Patescibacteria group bacterium]|nr:hypothetical protein [Patescibacteria group bacterium]